MPQKMQLKVLLSDAEKVVTISDGGLFLDVSSIQMFDANGAAVTDAGVVVTVGISADGLSYQSKVVSSDASLGGFEFKHIKVSVSGRTTASIVVVDVKVCSISEAMTSDSYKSRLAGLFTATPYTAETLPDPATLGAGATVVVDGHLVEVRNGSFALTETAFKQKAICADRLMSTPAVYPGVGKTSQMIRQAPAHFDAIRINVMSSASAGNAWKVTVAPSAAYNVLGPVDGAGVGITPTVVTFGSTNRKNPRNPGGGAVTVTSTGASGSGQGLIQDRIYSDVIKIKSLDRTDHPSRNPLIYVRIFGTDVPVFATNEINATDANPFSAVVPEFYAGMSGADNSVTNPGAWAQAGACPAVEIEFFVRGKIVRTIGICGDSTDQGWVGTPAVPQFGGNINGYMRRVVSAMNAAGNPTGYVSCAQAGASTVRHYNDVLPVIMSGCLTHLVIRPWTVNNVLIGTTAQVAYDAIAYAELLIQTCIEYGVVPVLLRPFAYGSGETIQQPIIKAFVDSYKESGGRVLDFTSITNLSDRYLKPEYLTLNSSGVVVDQIHPNDLAHQDVADYITAKLHWLFT